MVTPFLLPSPGHLLLTSSTHQCIGVSCCGCSRCRLAGRLWSSALWRKAGSRCCRSRSPECRRSNQQQAHLRSLARWAHRKTQLQAARGRLSTHRFMHSSRHIQARFVERRLISADMAGLHLFTEQSHFLGESVESTCNAKCSIYKSSCLLPIMLMSLQMVTNRVSKNENRNNCLSLTSNTPEKFRQQTLLLVDTLTQHSRKSLRVITNLNLDFIYF